MTMQCQIKIISPLGTFGSKPEFLKPIEVEELEKMLEDIQDLSYITIDTENGKIYFPGSIVK